MTISTDVSVRQSFLERTSGQNGHRLPSGAWRWGRGRSLFLNATWRREEEGSPFDTPHVHLHLKLPLQQLQGKLQGKQCLPWERHPQGSGSLLLPLLQGIPHPGIKPVPPTSPALAGGFFTTSTTWGAPPIFLGMLNQRTFFPCCTVIS